MQKHGRLVGVLGALLAVAFGRLVLQNIGIENIPSSIAIAGMVVLTIIFIYHSQKRIKLKKLSKDWVLVEIIFAIVILLEIILELMSNKNVGYYETMKIPITILQMVLLCIMIIPIVLILSKKKS